MTKLSSEALKHYLLRQSAPAYLLRRSATFQYQALEHYILRQSTQALPFKTKHSSFTFLDKALERYLKTEHSSATF